MQEQKKEEMCTKQCTKELCGTPAMQGYHMPGEYEPQEGCLMIWPGRPGSWPYEAREARIAFAEVIRAIAKSETVYVAVEKQWLDSANEMLADIPNVTLWEAETDDAWARDVGPTFLLDAKGHRSCVNWEFNAWGGTYNGLYASWEKDNAFAKTFAAYLQCPVFDAAPFVLEGGSIHCDGEGTVLVTETCLLSKGRNPDLSREEIEEKLKQWLGAEQIIWLPRGIDQDETDEHVDNVCAFIRPGEVVLAWTDNTEDPQYPLSLASYQTLCQAVDAKGRKLKIHKLPIPDHPICVQEEDLMGYQFEDGEDVREVGDRLAASYVNFYFANDAVVVPAFGGVNAQSDARAQRILQELCPERKVVPVMARAILAGGGNIHCITQQIPKCRKE